MSIRETPWPSGTPNWADLMTSDREASWAFYSEVLGWQIMDSGADMGHYGMASVGGLMVAGIGTPPDPDQAPPPAWITYLATDDLDRTCEAITARGVFTSCATPAASSPIDESFSACINWSSRFTRSVRS